LYVLITVTTVWSMNTNRSITNAANVLRENTNKRVPNNLTKREGIS